MLKTQNSAITISSVVVAEKDPISSTMQNEVAILDPRSGMYFGLGQVGSRIWELIQSPIQVKDICDAIIAEYDVPRDRCQTDLCILLSELLKNELIDVRNACNE